jgi:pyruvate dehydrogenase E2 component (dihydrolipoamide acetyltransferase)
MPTTFTLPELGENVKSGTVTAVLVKAGDRVEKDQTVVQLETDKAVVDVPSPQGGVVSEVRAKEGATLNVGDVILVLDGAGSAKPALEEKPAAPAAKPDERPLPAATAAAPVAAPKPAAPAPKPAPAPAAPAPTPPAAPALDTLEETTSAVASSAPEPASQPVSANTGTVRAAPSVRKLAREIGIDIAAVPSSNPGAAITAEDVKGYARTVRTGSVPVAENAAPPPSGGAAGLPNFEKWGPVTREKMSTIRRLTAEGMARSWGAVPHVTQHDKADITEVEKFRKDYGKLAEKAGGKLTVTAILVRLLAEALKRFPQFNASLDPSTGEIIYKQYYNIGVAVDTEWGLLVPNIKNADRKSLVQIAAELASLSERARQRKTSLDELQGGCITITNLGGIGGHAFTPIVNLPEVAILGVSRSSIEPVWIDGAFVPRTLMPISLSYDHRVIDGADAARFARWICAAIEQPMTMFVE